QRHLCIRDRMLKTNDADCNYLVNFASLYDVNSETFSKDFFGEPVEIEFEGHKFYAPSEADKILRILYNDYMVLPPVEKRKCKHHFSNFKE
ncbi:MAG: LicD family protein, partial [Eubacterium sp.]|nr:LicD family protein [Eubacterium sp.]